ncbi:hypothetical protein A3J34_00850 [Candidatus Peribacteria bacterium RIFCSPLOWO2_02_FULL_51_10]|nr:MAG: hypothetical protein A3J34_00850 [Candidatus Peribacteria bacterium RIFCSPLOWO2_02_FULL_51_10]
MSKSYKIIIGGAVALAGISAIGVLAVMAGIGWDEVAGMAAVLMHVRGFMTLSLGVALVCIVLAIEWNSILNYWRIKSFSLRQVEYVHPRLPSGFEIVSTNLLSLAFLLLSVQFISLVYAMSFSLFASTVETNGMISGAAADFDNDGDLDYVTGNYNGPTSVVFDQYMNDGNFSFTHSAFMITTYLKNVAGGDLNGDGRPDIIYATNFWPAVGQLFKGTMGASTFTLEQIAGTYFFGNVDLKDIDNDGDLDIVGAELGGHSVFLNDGHGNFTAANSTLGANGRIALADLNSDGYPDVAWVNVITVKTYINSGTGAFVPLSSVPTVATLQDVKTADFDGDGDIDVVTADDQNIIVWGNDGNGNLAALSSIPYGGGTSPGHMAPGDMDNDGDIDVIVGGKDNLTGNKIFVNDGAGTLTLSSTQSEAGDQTQDITAGDFDGDGDLDYIAGNTFGEVNRYYKNDQAATLPNTAPTAPNGFTALRISGGNGSGTVRLSWGSGSDTQTATRMLQYQLKVGTGSNSNNIVSGAQASPNYVSRQMPNGQSKTMLLKNLLCGDTYYWNVATVDTGYKTAWGTEAQFTISADCATVSNSTAAEADTGGGLSWTTIKQGTVKKEEEAGAIEGTITLMAFLDSNRNGKKEKNEIYGFEGLPVRVRGTDIGGGAADVSGTISGDGSVKLKVKASDGAGYFIGFDTGSTVIEGYRATVKSMSGVMLGAGQNLSREFGFRRKIMLQYRPCLSIGGRPETNLAVSNDNVALLGRLVDAYGNRITEGMDFGGQLVNRKTFQALLKKTQCSAEIMTSPNPLAPISRSEAVDLVAAATWAETETGSGDDALPEDLKAEDALSAPYLKLKRLKILPASFVRKLNGPAGVTPAETAELLTRAAMINGKIWLIEPDYDLEEETPSGNPTFLSLIGGFTRPQCLSKDLRRAENLAFTDMTPDDPWYADLRTLSMYGVKNGDGRVLWLIPGTAKATEFGVEKGESKLRGREAASLLETLRAMLLITCRTPDTAKEVTARLLGGETIREAGSGERRIPRDRISNRQRTAEFDSRVLYRSQDREREFELSLFSYAPGLLRKDFRDARGNLTIDEAAELMASALGGYGLKQGLIKPDKIYEKVLELRAALNEEFDKIGGEEGNRIFTREMLVKFLGTVVSERMLDGETTGAMPVGEMWWERVRGNK